MCGDSQPCFFFHWLDDLNGYLSLGLLGFKVRCFSGPFDQAHRLFRFSLFAICFVKWS